ncbi:hypothetical protein [Arthrobacter sp. TWP1-1]|uniref:hypothetical protein n=1 Tax=Arthrobacter sp. TWP1-1 TaxID=2804568 RepID=UPI003CF488C0
MFSWFRRNTATGLATGDSEQKSPALPAPLTLGSLLIEAVEIPARRASKPPQRVVQWSVGETQTRLHPEELHDLLAGRVGIIDSMTGSDGAFLCNAAGVQAAVQAEKPSRVGKWTAVFPPDALALLTGLISDEPAVIISREEQVTFARWLDTVSY